jgi:hypothetical protein
MKKIPAKKYLPVALVIVLGTLFYLNFQNYQPKILKQIEEVKGLKTSREVEIPQPQGSEQIAVNQTSETKQVTFRTTKTPMEVQDFYKNIFRDKTGWKVEIEAQRNSFLITKYKNGDQLVTVLSSKEDGEETTIASVEIGRD